MVDDGWFGIHNVPWGVAVAIGVLVGAAVAVVIGLPALRIPGLYLAVTTLAFAVFVENWLVTRRWLGVDELTGQMPALHKPDAGIVDFSSRRSYYYLCLALPRRCASPCSRRSAAPASGARSSRCATTNARPRR